MPKKIMQFFKKPSSILAILLAVALLGTGSLYALKAFAEGEVPTVPDDVLNHYTTSTVNHLFAQESGYDYVQVLCSESEVVNKDLNYRGGTSYFEYNALYDGENIFDTIQYDSDGDGINDKYYTQSSLKYTGEIPAKTYYVYENGSIYDDYGYICEGYASYIGSFSINQYEAIRYPTCSSLTSLVLSSVSLNTDGADSEYNDYGDYVITDTRAEKVHHHEPRPESQNNSETGEYYDYYTYDVTGNFLPSEHIAMLSAAGVDFSTATLHFFGRKERTYYKYGSRVQLNDGYASNLQVLIPNDPNGSSEVFLGYLNEWDSDTDADIRTFSIRSVAGILGIPGDAGTVITYDGDYGKVYLPVMVNVNYNNSSWQNTPHVLIRQNDVPNGTYDCEYDNTTDSRYVDGGLTGDVYFQLRGNDGTPPQMYYDEEGVYGSADSVPDDVWNDTTLTQTTQMWELIGDADTSFSVNGTTNIKNIFKEGCYTVSGGPDITFNVTLKSQFRIPGTYNLHYNLNPPTGTTVSNAATFANVDNIPESQVKDGNYTLSATEPTITGYTFTGWTLNNGNPAAAGGSIPFTCFDNTDCTATATANWVIKKHNITYYVYGEIPSGYTQPDNQTNVEFGTEITVADQPSYTGYTFTGWNVSGATPDANGKFNMPDSDVTITGTFYENRYNLNYVDNAPAGKTVTGMPANATYIRYTDVKDGGYTLSSDVPACEGYRFLGWKLNVTDGNKAAGAAIPFENFNVEGRAATATAQWEEIPKHNVTYTIVKPANSDDITYTAPSVESYYEDTENIAVKAVPTAGTDYNSARYSFEGWTPSDNVTVTGGKFTMPTGDVTFTGTFTKNKYTLTYQVEQDVPSGYSPPASHNIQVDEVVTVAAKPDMSLYPGYTFTGWRFENTDTYYDANDTFKMPAADTWLIGVFQKISYHVTYSVTGGPASYTPPTDTTDYYVGSSAPVAAVPNITGYTFDGWYQGGTKVSGSITMPAADVELTGVFTENTYALDYQDGGKDGATIPTDESGLTYTAVKDGYALSSTKPTVAGYSFKSWLVNGTEYAEGATIPFSAFNNGSKTAVAVAQWNDWTYHVVYEKDEGHDSATGMPENKDYLYGDVHIAPYQSISTQKPTDEGFIFTGWNVQQKDNISTLYTVAQLDDDSVSKVITDADFPTDTRTITVTAQWEPVPTYTVTYTVTSTDPTADKYTLPTDSHAYHEGDNVNVAAALSVEGYTFDGWYKDGTKVTSFDMPAGNVVLTGSFTKNPEPEPTTYTIRYHGNGKPDGNYSDVDVNTDSVPANVSLTSDQLEDGYTLTGSCGSADAPKSADGEFDFVCWCKTPAHSAEGVISTATVGDFGTGDVLDVYAVWIKHVEVEYNKGKPAADSNGTFRATDVFDLDIMTLQYTVKSIEDLGDAFKFDNYKFDYWLVVETDKPIIRHQKASSGASSEPARKYADSETIGVDGKLYPGDRLSLNGDVKLTAIWKSKVTLTYKANGGSPKSAVPNEENPIEYWTGDTVTVQSGDSLKNGDQTFDHWSTTANDETGSTHYKTGNTFTIDKDTVLYAIYSDAPGSESGKEYTVTYDANGGTGTIPTDATKYQGGETVTVKDKGDLVRTDCTFKEWNTSKDGSGTAYKGDGTDSFTMPESNVTLYAIWTDGNGNIVPYSPGTGESNVPLMLALNVFVLSMLAGSAVMLRQYRTRREEA